MLFNNIKKKYLKNKISKINPIKIVCGAANTKYSGWISTNINVLNITKECDFKFLFDNNKINNILLEHVIEHLEYDDFISFLLIAKKYLKRGGAIRIAVPDKNHPSQYVRELTGVNGTEPGADDHKYFYSIEDMKIIGNKTGYKINEIEYFDASGTFHSVNINYDNGYIQRCSKNYKGRFTNSKDEYMKMINSVPEKLRNQFKEYNISYTSLIVDFIYE